MTYAQLPSAKKSFHCIQNANEWFNIKMPLRTNKNKFYQLSTVKQTIFNNLLLKDFNSFSINNKFATVRFHFSLIASMGAVILEHVNLKIIVRPSSHAALADILHLQEWAEWT